MRNIERRGLAEVVAWTTSVFTVGAVTAVYLVKTGEVNHSLLGLFIGCVTTLLARGTRSATERSAKSHIAREAERAAEDHALRAEAAASRAERILQSSKRESEK